MPGTPPELPPDTPVRRTLTITHDYAEGTVLDGTRRSDDLYPLLRGLGWLYRRTVGDFVLQASKDRPAKRGPIERTTAALRARGFDVEITIATTPRPVAQTEAELTEAVQVRAGRLAGRAERLHEQADAREAAAARVLDHIPPGQPLLVDHHSYRGDRRRRERAFTNLERSVELTREARTLERAAEVAAARMDLRRSPTTVVTRVRELGADLRRIQRRRDEHTRREELLAAGVPADEVGSPALTEQAAARLDEEETHLRALLQHWSEVRAQQVRDGVATDYRRTDLNVGDLVLFRGDWFPVLRANPTSVSVPSRVGGDWSHTIRYEMVEDVAGVDDPRRPRLLLDAYAVAHARHGNAPLHPVWNELVP